MHYKINNDYSRNNIFAVHDFWVLLNQVCVGCRLAHAGFLIIASVRECLHVNVCVCLSAPEAMNN